MRPETPIQGRSDYLEEYWMPEVQPVPQGLREHPLPQMRPPADHDGTACFKWDDTLWSHADHFKVRRGPGCCVFRTCEQLAATALPSALMCCGP